jgi:hypothetical protein
MYTMPGRRRGFGDTASVQCGPDEEYDLAALACVKKGTAQIPAPSVPIPQIPILPQFGPPPASPEQPPMKPMPTPAQVLPAQQQPSPAPAPTTTTSIWPWVVGGLAVVGAVVVVRSL